MSDNNISEWARAASIMVETVVEALPAERQAQLRGLLALGKVRLVAFTDGTRVSVGLVDTAGLAASALWTVDTHDDAHASHGDVQPPATLQ